MRVAAMTGQTGGMVAGDFIGPIVHAVLQRFRQGGMTALARFFLLCATHLA